MKNKPDDLWDYAHPTQRSKWAWLYIAFIVSFVLALVLILNSCAYSAEPTDKKAIKAIIGEAENQGYKGMLAVACAIRNRGTLKGVYGAKSKRVIYKQYSIETYNISKKAWNNSSVVDITHGANHWENIHAFGKPYWARNEVFRFKDHIFYRI